MQQPDYDIVVVGSGIGGFSVGALLSHWGYKTLVVEKMPTIGGRCSTEEYEGFKLPTGSITLVYEDMEKVFKEVGAELQLVDVPRLFWKIGGKDYEMPPKGAVRMLFNIINKLEEDRAKELGRLAKLVPIEKILTALPEAIKEPEKEAGLTFKDWLLQYTDNELIHEVFNTMTGAIPGTPSHEVSASGVFGWFAKMGGSRQMGIAPRGNIVNMENLAKVIRSNGDVWVNCPAKRILITGKEAKGVVMQRDGNEIEIRCQVVISDVGLKGTVELAGQENFDEEYLRAMRLKNRPQVSSQCFVASDRPLWPESGEPAVLMIVGARRLKAVVPLSNISLDFAPPGQHLMYGMAPAVTNEIHMNVELEQGQVLLDLEEQFPLFEKRGRILKMLSRDIDDELPAIRTRVGDGMPSETPVRNLYNVGDATYSFGLIGATGAAESGRRVAQTVRKYFKPGQI